MEPLIKAENLEIIYNLGKSNEFHALRNASFEIYPEEYVILFGPSGCGKSTILYCLLGVLPYTYGKLQIKGQDPYRLPIEDLVKFQQKIIGIIYQAFYLIPSISVLDNVALPMIFMGIPPAEREKRAISLLNRFGIGAQANKIPASLSGGQQQRVAVARSLINEPEILLADEPVGNLDSVSTQQVMKMLDEINQKEKKTIVLVTHDARHIPYAHRTYKLKDGMIIGEVINPEKKQIKPVDPLKSLTTDLEKLARLYPYASPEELQVKSIINFLTQKFNFDELTRLENAVSMLISGKINLEAFQNFLETPFEAGGVGIRKPAAREMAEVVEKLITESLDIKRLREKLITKAPSPEKNPYIKNLRMHLLDEYEGEINPTQLHRLEKAIEERVAGKLKKDDFQNELSKPLKNGGIGFRRPAAKKLTSLLEILLVQGIKT
jgi:putative ABC transport system ATP-binding protein